MKAQNFQVNSRRILYVSIGLLSIGLLSLTCSAAFAQGEESQDTATTQEETPKLASGELDSLVAPVALYSDELLAQTLAASTYPLEVIQLQQWMDQNKNLEGTALADAAAKQPWDPSVQGLVAFPDVVQRMAGNIQWTTDLGNAFLDQQSDVMDAIQRMRAKAQGTGNLKTSSQQTVETKTVEGGRQVITVEPANPERVYVPSYDPAVVYGPAEPAYPYYNYTYPGYVPGTALAWGAGVALTAAAWGSWGGYWGHCDWNHGDVTINNYNNFNKNYNKNVNKNVSGTRTAQGAWQHNPQHRGNTPYANKQTANKFGGTTRGQGGARTNAATANATGAGNRPGGGAGTGNRSNGGASLNSKPGVTGNKPGGAGVNGGNRSSGSGTIAKSGSGASGAGNRASGAAASKSGGGTAKTQAANRTASKTGGGSKAAGPGAGAGNAKASSNRAGKTIDGNAANRAAPGGDRKNKGKAKSDSRRR